MKQKPAKGDRTLIKHMNQRLVLQYIQGQGPISRRDITRLSGLSAASVTGIVNTLIDTGLVYEFGEDDEVRTVGRRPVLLRLNPNAGLVVGVKIGVYSISCVLTDLDATVLFSTEYPLSLENRDGAPQNPDATIQLVKKVIDSLLVKAAIPIEKVLGIGIGINGVVDVDLGVSVDAPHFGWKNVLLTEPLSDYYHLPVFLENDARVLTIAEKLFGAGRDASYFVSVVVGYGIGSGFITEKNVYRGGSGGAGEFGHIILQPGGPLCSCGKNGCLESLASIPAVFREISCAIEHGESSALNLKQPLTTDMVAIAASQGDALATRVLESAGQWLGLGIASLVNILNPEQLVINGEALNFGEHYLKSMENALKENVFNGLLDKLVITIDPGGNEIWARGAACLVLNSIFTTPR